MHLLGGWDSSLCCKTLSVCFTSERKLHHGRAECPTSEIESAPSAYAGAGAGRLCRFMPARCGHGYNHELLARKSELRKIQGQA